MLCYSARGMMFALGCIQALRCNEDVCPVGVAAQRPHLYKGLDVEDKYVRVAQFHRNTLRATVEMMEACGFNSLDEVLRIAFSVRSTAKTLTFRRLGGKNRQIGQ